MASLPPVQRIGPPSPWFTAHQALLRPGARVLDLACGSGRHAVAAARLGCRVVGVDRDARKLAIARAAAEAADSELELQLIEADLDGEWPAIGHFDAILCFNYLDRLRMPEIVSRLEPGGHFFFETFLAAQRSLGWGPSQADHLLQSGELVGMLAPLTVLYGREALEPLGNDRWRWVASAIARR